MKPKTNEPSKLNLHVCQNRVVVQRFFLDTGETERAQKVSQTQTTSRWMTRKRFTENQCVLLPVRHWTPDTEGPAIDSGLSTVPSLDSCVHHSIQSPSSNSDSSSESLYSTAMRRERIVATSFPTRSCLASCSRCSSTFRS